MSKKITFKVFGSGGCLNNHTRGCSAMCLEIVSTSLQDESKKRQGLVYLYNSIWSRGKIWPNYTFSHFPKPNFLYNVQICRNMRRMFLRFSGNHLFYFFYFLLRKHLLHNIICAFMTQIFLSRNPSKYVYTAVSICTQTALSNLSDFNFQPMFARVCM